MHVWTRTGNVPTWGRVKHVVLAFLLREMLPIALGEGGAGSHCSFSLHGVGTLPGGSQPAG